MLIFDRLIKIHSLMSIVPTVMFNSETWEINARLRRRVNVLIMSCLRPIRGVTVKDRMRNNDNRPRSGLKNEFMRGGISQ